MTHTGGARLFPIQGPIVCQTSQSMHGRNNDGKIGSGARVAGPDSGLIQRQAGLVGFFVTFPSRPSHVHSSGLVASFAPETGRAMDGSVAQDRGEEPGGAGELGWLAETLDRIPARMIL